MAVDLAQEYEIDDPDMQTDQQRELEKALAASGLVKQSVDDWLNQVDYGTLNSGHYLPGSFALKFMTFIKLVNGEEGEQNKTPVVHLAMLDEIDGLKKQIANLCHRGLGKALSLDTPLPTPTGWTTMGKVKVGDEVLGEDGKPAKVTFKSEVHNKPMYRLRLADGRVLDVCEDHVNVVVHQRQKRVDGRRINYLDRRELTTKELLELNLTTTRNPSVKNPKGKENRVWIPLPAPIEYAEKDLLVDPYTLGILLGDGSMCRKAGHARLHTHEDDLPHYQSRVPYEFGKMGRDGRRPSVISIGIKGLGKSLKKLGANCHGNDKRIPVDYFLGSVQQRLALLQGLMDTDGSAEGSDIFSSSSEGLARDVMRIVYSLGGSASISQQMAASGRPAYRVSVNLPFCSFSLPRKVAKSRTGFRDKIPLESIEPCPSVPSQCIQVSNKTHTYLAGDFVVTHNTTVFSEYLFLYIGVFGEIEGFGRIDGAIYVSDSMENGVKSLRKNMEFRYNQSEWLQEWLPDASFTDSYIEFGNKEGHRFGLKMFGAKTGLRGTKIFGKRPVLCVLDDLVSDDDSKSKVAMQAIKDTVHKGVKAALHPTHRKIIFNGTPFNKGDILYEAVESGAWHVNVWPVCEKFPCSKEEFRGSWEDRFTYEFVEEEYRNALLEGTLSAFMQEYMLRISSDEEKLIQENEIRWYSRQSLLKNRNRFNFYITTDFATKAKQSADFSVISVWAYNANGDWFWVDGICEKQTMNKNIDDLFRLAQIYRPQSVGVEIAGQQGAFIDWIMTEQMNRNIWFTLAMGRNGKPGIQPETDKLSRFNLVVPWFKAGKMYWPSEMKASQIMGEAMQEITLATITGFKSKHDDFVDTISMLAYLKTWKPSEDSPSRHDVDSDVWDLEDEFANEPSPIQSYIV